MKKSKKVEIVRKKAPVIERGPKQPVKQKVVVLRKVREGEEFSKEQEIPVSIGIPKYFQELKKADELKEREAKKFSNKIIIFFIGGPGCGKGTQSQKMIDAYDIGYMSAGELLRQEASSDSELGRSLKEQMTAGLIVPMEVTIGLLKKEILKQEKEIYLIDGFPRAIDQGICFEQNVCPAKIAIYLQVPDEVLIERLIKRSENSGRDDDNPETIQKRLKTFHEVSEPVFKYFEDSGRGALIDGNREPDVVFRDIRRVIDKILGRETPPPEHEEEEAKIENLENEMKE